MGRGSRDLFVVAWPIIVLSLVLVVIVAAAGQASPSVQRVVTEMLIRVVIVVGAYIFIGNSGVLSFGHVGFMAIGAYVTAWLTIPVAQKPYVLPDLPAFLATAEWSTLPAALVAGAAASLVALLFGFALMRLSGIAASIGTFALLVIVQSVFSHWDEMTGGASSLYGLPTYTTMTVALAWAVVTMIAAFVYQQSNSGFRLRGSREDPVAAASFGVNIHRERLTAFVVSAFFVGIGGVLHAHFLGIVVASSFFLATTFLLIAMLVIGGISSLSGAVVGVVAVSLLAELLRRAEAGIDLGILVIPGGPGLREVGLAFVMLVILVFRPNGLMNGREIGMPAIVRLLIGRANEPSLKSSESSECN